MPSTPSDAPPALVRLCLWSVSKSFTRQTATPLEYQGTSSSRAFTFSSDGRLLGSSFNHLNIASRLYDGVTEKIAQTCFQLHPANLEGSSWLKSVTAALGTVEVRAALGYQFRDSITIQSEASQPSAEVLERMFATSYFALVTTYLEQDLPTAETFLRNHLAPIISELALCFRNFNGVPNEEEIAQVAAKPKDTYTKHTLDETFFASGPPPVYELNDETYTAAMQEDLELDDASDATSLGTPA